jgi:hypothetical protein
MDKEQWVSIAKHDPGCGRANMEQAWRERDYLAATDGHRIHLAGGYPKIEGIRYVDERQDTPPNVQVIFDVTDKASLVASLELDKNVLKTLKTLASLKEWVRCTIKAEWDTPHVTLHGKGLATGLQLELKILNTNARHTSEITVRLDYLWEAISWIKPDYKGTIDLYWDVRKTESPMLKVRAEDRDLTAIIAPMHKD